MEAQEKSSIIKKLQKKACVFSEAIKYTHQHGDDLWVGGRITSVFNLCDILNEEQHLVQISIDDFVGISTLMIPKEIYDAYKEKDIFKIDSLIIAKGRLYDPNKKVKESGPTVICWHFEKLLMSFK